MNEDNMLEKVAKDVEYFISLFPDQIGELAKEFMRHFPDKGLSYQEDDTTIESLIVHAKAKFKVVYLIVYDMKKKNETFDNMHEDQKKVIERALIDSVNLLFMALTKIK